MKLAAFNTAFAFLCAIAGASVALVVAVPLWLGVAAGAGVGSLSAWLPRIVDHLATRRCAELVSFAFLVVIAAVASARGILPALNGVPVRLESSLPLLLIAPALYGTYMMLNRSNEGTRYDTMAGRLTAALSGPPLILTLALAVVVATCAVLLIRYAGLHHSSWQGLAAKFVDRGIIPPITLVLFFWGVLLLANKTWVLWRERRSLNTNNRSGSALLAAHAQAIGRGEGDADDFFAVMWKKSADFYTVPRYINWAIPILGFIGTVLGISLAADGIQNIIGSGGGLSDLSSELGQAIAPLGIAFDTTLIALSLSVFLMLLQTALQRWEDDILVDCENLIKADA